MSAETLIAFERASRALGRIDGAYRAARASLAGTHLTLTMEALATVAVADEEASWSKLRHAMAALPSPQRAESPHARTAKALHRAMGLTGATGRGRDPKHGFTFRAALQWWPSALGSDGPMPEHFERDLRQDLRTWVADGGQPALVKAAIATMVVAATKPDCADTGIVARQLFVVVLEAAGGARRWSAPPISSWFVHDPASWELVASALANDGKPDPDAVDLGLRSVFDAVTRSATANAFQVEWASRDATSLLWHSDTKLTFRQQVLFEILVGLPALSPEYVPALLDVTDRGARRIIKTLMDSGLVVQRHNRRGDPYLMVPGGARARLESVPGYELPGPEFAEV